MIYNDVMLQGTLEPGTGPEAYSVWYSDGDIGEMSKAMLAEDAWFEKFGLLTVGPVDGHDLPTLVDMLMNIKDVDRPIVLHAHTIKGKGYEFAEGDATTFHSPKPFEVNGCRVELKSGGRSFTAAFADALEEILRLVKEDLQKNIINQHQNIPEQKVQIKVINFYQKINHLEKKLKKK